MPSNSNVRGNFDSTQYDAKDHTVKGPQNHQSSNFIAPITEDVNKYKNHGCRNKLTQQQVIPSTEINNAQIDRTQYQQKSNMTDMSKAPEYISVSNVRGTIKFDKYTNKAITETKKIENEFIPDMMPNKKMMPDDHMINKNKSRKSNMIKNNYAFHGTLGYGDQ